MVPCSSPLSAKPAASLRSTLDQRKRLETEIEALLEAHPLSAVLTSMPGIGVRTGARILTEVRRRHQLRHRRPPRLLRRAGARHPPLRQLHSRRSTRPRWKQATQARLLPRRLRRAARPDLPHLLRPQDRRRQTAQPSPDMSRPPTLRRPLRNAQKRDILRTPPRPHGLTSDIEAPPRWARPRWSSRAAHEDACFSGESISAAVDHPRLR